MKSRFLLLLAMAMLAAIIAPPGAAAVAAPLMCQARAAGFDPQPPPTEVSFQALVAGGSLPLTFDWDFRDGSSSTEQNPTHTFAEGGIYAVQLTVTDNGETPQVCRDTVLVLVQVFIDPLCGATADPRWGNASLSVDFGAYEAFVPDPPPYTWSWRFGDGGTSTQQRPTHTYSVPGTYWAVATLHTTSSSYDCWPALRVSAIPRVVEGVEREGSTHDLRLEAPRPNPFAAMTAFGFELPRAGNARLAVVDVNGRLAAVVMEGYRPAGRSFAAWQGRSSSGQAVPPGLYFARLEFEGVTKSVRVVRVP